MSNLECISANKMDSIGSFERFQLSNLPLRDIMDNFFLASIKNRKSMWRPQGQYYLLAIKNES